MKRGYDRTQRVADLLQKTLAPMLLEMHDDRLQFVTITSVSVSRDLSYAKIYVGVLTEDADQIKQTIDILNRSVKSLRYNVAKAVKLRIAPELKFVYDESTAHGFKISSLISAAEKKSDKDNE